MTDKNNIEDVFRNTLENYEAEVNPKLWQSIASKIPVASSTTAASTATAFKGIAAKWIAGIVVVGAVSTASYLLVTSEKENSEQNSKELTTTEQLVTQSNEQISNNSIQPEQNHISKHEVESTKLTQESPKRSETQQKPTQELTANSQSEPVNQTAIVTEQKTENANAGEVTSNNTQPKQTEANQAEDEDDAYQNQAEAINPQVEQKEPLAIGNYFEFIPNVITPNGDGANDSFKLNPTENVKSFKVIIFDRSGSTIKEWNSPEGSWDGNLKNGMPAPKGTYFFMIIGESTDGKPIFNNRSTLTLIR